MAPDLHQRPPEMRSTANLASARVKPTASVSRRHALPILAAATALALCAAAALRTPRPDPLPGFPRLVLWAWEMPERMPFLDPHSTAVAFLARTIRIRAAGIESRPRLQPLGVPPGTPMMAVVRIETVPGAPLPYAGLVAEDAAHAAAIPGIRVLQIDFDARRSERSWYRDLLARLREKIPPAMPLEITALASWCQSDRWLAGLPIADAVPMLFQMGPGEQFDGADFREPLCRAALGLDPGDLPAAVPHGRRIYLFYSRPWTPETYHAALRLASKLQ